MKRTLCSLTALWLSALLIPTARGQHTSSAAIDRMPGLVLRMNAESLKLPDGTPVVEWPNTADPTRSATAVVAPIYRENILNGKGVVRFSKSGASRLEIAGGGVMLNDWTMFFVHRTSGECSFMGHGTGDVQIRIGRDDENRLGAWDGAQAATGHLLAVPRTAWNIAEFRRDGPFLAFQESGASRGHGPWAGPATFDQIGAVAGMPALEGDLAEILVFSRKLSMTDEATVYDYFNGEYGIVPILLPVPHAHPAPAIPKLFSNLHYENAANIDFRSLPIDREHVYQFSGGMVNPDLLAFTWALWWKIPNPNATGYASLDLELASPGLLPPVAAAYAGAPWTTTDRAYIISLLKYARSVRPRVKWGVYWHPYYDTIAIRSPLYGYYASNADWFNAYTGRGGLVDVLGYCDTLQPEIYPHDLTETQADSNFVAAANVQLCRDISDYYVTPRVPRETVPMAWVQVVPSHIGPGVEGDFLSQAVLTQRLIALRLSGADAVFLAGNAGPQFYTPEQWQEWADTTLTRALTASGFYCFPNCDGSTTPPVLNILDFGCFLNRFAAGDQAANCDNSTALPILNVLDFACFLNSFASGCP